MMMFNKLSVPRGRALAFWLVGISIASVSLFVHGTAWRGTSQLHTLMEVAATLLALFVGAMALVRHYTQKEVTFLFIGAGFLGTAFLDAYHAVVTSEYFRPFMPSDLPSLIPWSWVASRFFLSVVMFLSYVAWRRQFRLGEAGRIKEATVYLYMGAFTLASFLFFAFVPLPRGYFVEFGFNRPEEFVPAFFFLLALVGYLHKGEWRRDAFEYWVVLSLIIGFVNQAEIVSHSEQLFDLEFDLAHLLKKLSYICVLSGLLTSVFGAFKRAEGSARSLAQANVDLHREIRERAAADAALKQSEERFRGAIAALQEGFALYDSDDRLVICNEQYIKMHPAIKDMIVPGVTYEELLKANARSGLNALAIGNEEEYIRDRLVLHRNPGEPLYRELTDGRWLFIQESRTPEGGIVSVETDITDLKRSEQALRQSEQTLRDVMDAVPALINIKDTDSRYLYKNQFHADFYGLAKEAGIGEVSRLVSTRHGDRMRALEARVVENGETLPFYDDEMADKNGVMRNLLVTKAPLTDLSGKVTGIVTAAIDITERKRAEEALRASEARFRTLIDSSSYGIMVIQNQIPLYANQALADVYGYKSPDDVIALGTTRKLIAPEELEAATERHQKRMRGKPVDVDLVIRGVKADGTKNWVQLRSFPIDWGGERAVCSIRTDITERIQAEEALRASESRFRALFESFNQGILVHRDHKALHVNPALVELYGYDSAEEILNLETTQLLIAPEFRDRSRHDSVLHEGKQLEDRDYQGLRKDGSVFWVHRRGFLIDWDGAPAMCSIRTDITERRRAEEALRSSEQRFRTLIDSSSYGIAVHRSDNFLFANQALADIYGYKSPDEVMALDSTLDLVAPEERGRIKVRHKKHLEGDESEPDTTARGLKADGTLNWVRVRAFGIDWDGQRAICSVRQDITDQRQAEEALRASEARFRTLIDSSSQGILVHRRYTPLYANQALADLYGYASPDEITGLTSTLNLSTMGGRQHRSGEEGDADLLARGTKKDGARIWVESRSFPIDWDGEPAVCSIRVDVTERRNAEEALRESEERVRTIVDSVVDGIITIDARGIIQTVNRSAIDIFGYSAGEMVGNNVRMLMPEPFRSGHDGYLANYLRTGKAKIIGIGREVEGLRRNGETFPMDLAVSDLKVSGGERMFVGITRDITERKEVDRFKNEFISTVSHELRTPLTSIRGSLGLINSGKAGKLPKKSQRLLDLAEKNTERLILLVNDILDMEKIASGKMVFNFDDVDIGELVEQSLEANKAYADGFGVDFVLVETVPGARIRGDRDRLLQVMANLLSNAAKFSPEEGEVRISVCRRGANVRVSVSDKGPGIPEEFRDDLFARFTQADTSNTREKGGTGLGLNITKSIIDRHGGRIDFETEIGAGTTFYFDLLAQDLNEQNGADHGKPERKAASASGRILIVEDDRDVAKLLSMMLSEYGFSSDIAPDAGRAEALLKKNTYDAMTVDIVLPDHDGLSLIRDLRAGPDYKDLPTIIVSATADEARHEMAGSCLGILDWIQKPLDQDRLRETLMRAVKTGGQGPSRVLYVEDDKDLIEITTNLLKPMADILAVGTLKEARKHLRKDKFDLVIIDINLPDGSGLDLLPVLKRNGGSATPVVIFSAEEVGRDIAAEVEAALVKSRTTNKKFMETIKALIPALGKDAA